MAELLIAVNPNEDSRLPYLLRIQQPGGDLMFQTSGTWPRVKALYCYPVGLADLAALPRAALVVEDRYSQLFKLDRVRPAVVADGLAELQVRWPNVPVVFCEIRQLAEEWTYRFLAAAHVWATTEHAALQRILPTRIDISHLDQAAATPEPSTAEVRAWARAAGLPVPDRGRLHPDIWQAWHNANDANWPHR